MSNFKYKMIIDDIVHKINEGELKPGEKLPSQRAIAQYYNVNRSTVVESLDILKSYGVLDTIEKKGVFISQYKWNTYITSNISWQDYIGKSVSKNNQYYIQKINELEFDENMIRLGTGELSPDLIPNHLFTEILNSGGKEKLNTNYEAPKGKLALRLEIVEYMRKRGVECDVDNICVTSGALQGLKLIADGLLIPQSKIIIETPSYINSVRTWHNIRARMVHLTIDHIRCNINNLFKARSDYKNSIFYCIPTLHNPTQNTYTKSEKQKIINQCQKNGVPIVEDDIYGDLWFNSERPLPMKALNNSDNVLYLGSLSKTVSPGLRIGWIVADKNVIRHLSDLKMQNDYGASSISQHIARIWLSDYHDSHINDLKKKLIYKRELFLNSLKKYLSDYGEWNKPEGSFYIWFKLHISIDLKTLFNEAIKENILIQPGEIYDNRASNYIRFSYSYINENQIDESIKRLKDIISRIS
ncbi:aspartate aminotransferase [Virgibacillus dokdonensis]|uniref:HTH-type transcriptional regulator NorG n=1 Tax=Virgibacillus dokdonensis TaxID=302167 RepID=A0A3E0WP41_9BACI|nr:PLP-dependent aminotransferase family protein [Virgibacillus dokdonensis]RFA34169.1 aspartate aminotransferase [Virgibacillus dokdonensis]